MLQTSNGCMTVGSHTMQHFSFSVVGTSPMITHNGGNIDPLNPINKLKSEFTSKRKKSEDDHQNIARIEWFQGLYLKGRMELELRGEKYYLSTKNMPELILPVKCVRATVIAGAKHNKNGKNIARAIQFSSVDFYKPSSSGKKMSFPDVNVMSDDPAYIDATPMTVNRAKVMRYRPIFEQWGFTVKGVLHENILDPKALQDAIQTAGAYEGINDSRAYGFGRYELTEFLVS